MYYSVLQSSLCILIHPACVYCLCVRSEISIVSDLIIISRLLCTLSICSQFTATLVWASLMTSLTSVPTVILLGANWDSCIRVLLNRMSVPPPPLPPPLPPLSPLPSPSPPPSLPLTLPLPSPLSPPLSPLSLSPSLPPHSDMYHFAQQFVHCPFH